MTVSAVIQMPVTSLWARPHRFPNCGFWPFPKVSHGFHPCPVVNCLPGKNATHNPKVAGSNPAPATKQLKILNGFREQPGGRSYVWRGFRQDLGKQFLAKKCSKHTGNPEIACRCQMRVSHGCVCSAARCRKIYKLVTNA